MYLGNDRPGYPLVFVSNKRRVPASIVNLAIRRLSGHNIDGTARGWAPPQGKRNLLFYASALGVASASLYYVLANGPTRSAPTSSTAPLSPSHFTPARLTSNIACTPHTKLLTFSLPPHLLPGTAGRPPSIFSIFVKDSDIQVERPYTPLEGIDEQGRMKFWVKRYQGGEVGRWLHERKVGDQIEIRGPIQNWKWQDGEWDEIIMISGGTGITPFYQLMYSIFSSISDKNIPHTRFTLLHSSPTPLDLPPPAILDPLQSLARLHPQSFSLKLYVDTLDGRAPRGNLLPLNSGRIGRRAVENVLARQSARDVSWWKRLWLSFRPPDIVGKKILFLVCGPEPMVAAIAGPRARDLTQGRVGGILGEMKFESDQVFKL